MERVTAARPAFDARWIEDFCRGNQIRWLALFGSVLREDFHSNSDIDVLVEFEPDARVGFIGIAAMEEHLSKELGRKVDLRTPPDLSRYFRQKVRDSAEVLYERR